MTIRPRTHDDLNACVTALAEVQATDRYPVHWPDDPAAWLTPDDLIGAWVATTPNPALKPTPTAPATTSAPTTATANDHAPTAPATVFGHVAVTRDLEITRLFVTPAARGRGLAEALLGTVRAAVPGPLKLEVSSEGEAAIRFYERSGWRRTGTTRATWLNAAGEPALLHHFVSPPPGR
ncbi:GNAT family N-acetyltransferase [Nonomuraea sp. NPDC050643]|uniref:GNAT family N-acetyltransferase n=1 Tax=Nonomuraea sp. NPDC050643 TaxID=3155660 RepID=UPI0033F4BCD4